MAPRAIKHMLMSPGPGLGLLAALGWLNVWSARATRRLGWVALGAALVPFIVCTTTESSERYVAVFLPLWAAGAAWGAMSLGEGYGRARQLAAVLLLVLLPFTLRAWMTEARQAAALRDWLAHERTGLASRATPAGRARLLFSDTPDFAAWTTQRSTVATTVEGYRATLTWNAQHFPSLMFWFSNYGRKAPPWSGRHLALGVENVGGVT